VFLIGAVYVGCSVTDQIDARQLGFAGRVEGVNGLVERYFGPSRTTAPTRGEGNPGVTGPLEEQLHRV
jgi:hypothetical protein